MSIRVCATTALALASSIAAAQPVQFPGSPIEKTSFQENLWEDVWGDEFVSGTDFLMSSDTLSSPIHTIHRLEWDESNTYLDGEAGAGILSNVQSFDMDWSEYGTVPVTYTLPDQSQWNATVTISTSAFAGTISSGNGYEPHIYGMVKSLTITENVNSGGFTHSYES